MKPRSKKILKWIGIGIGLLILILIAVALGLYVNAIIPKFKSVPVVLQKQLFEKPQQHFPMGGKYI